MLGEVFDPKAPLAISEHCRPHWSQTGAVAFVTFRTEDSIPKIVLRRWESEKEDWVRRQTGVTELHWKDALGVLTPELRTAFNKTFNRARESYLDTCHGRCHFRNPELAEIVARSLLHFDGVRYRMGDFVVMPNHVHLLASFASEEALREQCDSWMHFTAYEINKKLGRKGKLWQQEPFDHLVRSVEQYEYLRGYIKNNGPKARLSPSEYLYRRLED